MAHLRKPRPNLALLSTGLLWQQLHLQLIQEEMRELLPPNYRHLLMPRGCYNLDLQPFLVKPGKSSRSWGGVPTLGQPWPSWMVRQRKARAMARSSTMTTTLTPSQSTPPSMRGNSGCVDSCSTALAADMPLATPRWTSTAPWTLLEILASATPAETIICMTFSDDYLSVTITMSIFQCFMCCIGDNCCWSS